MSHTTLTFSYWARKNMAATCLQWSPYDSINGLFTFCNILLAAVVTLQCICLQNTTQHKLQKYIYVYKRRKYVTFRLQVNCHCCTIVYQIITQLIETLCMEFYFNREVKCRRNMSDKIKRGVKFGEKIVFTKLHNDKFYTLNESVLIILLILCTFMYLQY